MPTVPDTPPEDFFSQWLRRRRKLYALSPARLAQQVGCSAVMIRKLEAGTRHASAELAQRLAVNLGVPPDHRAAFKSFAATGQPPATFLPPTGAAIQLACTYDAAITGSIQRGPGPDFCMIYASLTGDIAPDDIGPDNIRPDADDVPGTRALSGTIQLQTTLKTTATGLKHDQPYPVAVQCSMQGAFGRLEIDYTGLLRPAVNVLGTGTAFMAGRGRVLRVDPALAESFLAAVQVECVQQIRDGDLITERGYITVLTG